MVVSTEQKGPNNVERNHTNNIKNEHEHEHRASVSSIPTISVNWDHSALQNNPTSTHELALALVPSQHHPRRDKASQVLGVAHSKSMEPIPASTRQPTMSIRSATYPSRPPSSPPHNPTSTLASLYVVSGLPKSPHTWNLADTDSTFGLHHSEGAVGRFWRAEVLGHTVSAGVGGKRKKRGGGPEVKGPGALNKPEVAKMLSKTLKLSFTREVEIVASTLQPASTIHTFTFTTANASANVSPFIRNSLIAGPPDHRLSTYAQSASALPYIPGSDPFAAPTSSSAYLAVPQSGTERRSASNTANQQATTTWHGVCLTVWSHADAERSTAIRRALEATVGSNRARTESAYSVTSTKLRSLRAERRRRGASLQPNNPTLETATEGDTDGDGISESEYDGASMKGPGGSTLFLPGDTIFWLPYALTLVSKHPIYDLMRDYLTLSWARFSKDVAAHTLQISKILACPAPRPGDIIRLDASSSGSNSKEEEAQGTLEVVCRFPGGLDFSKGLVDTNFTMWPLFKALSLDNILTICEIAMAPTGRILFLSRYPAMLGMAVFTIKSIVESRGWNGVALPIAHCRDAKIYVDDPGPWIIGISTEARYSVRPSSEVCVCDIDINYVNCASPPAHCVSVKQQREKFKQRLIAALDSYYHPDQAIPSEFKEAFPAGRFRPLCKIQAKRGVSNTSAAVISEMIKPPEWWNGAKVMQALDSILLEKSRRPSLFQRLTGTAKRIPKLTPAEQAIQLSIRKRATAFVDARDDLETRIGRLSRRLNFLVTESDLWREKFVTFEQYAEKLASEATELRNKINKEQRESKRLSGMINATVVEKARLEKKLQDTEVAHTSAVQELEAMRLEMERLEEEREQMVAEVEAQIERALASMTIEEDDDMYRSKSRPLSPRSRPTSPPELRSRSAPGSRRPSVTAALAMPVRDSFATDTTAAEPLQSPKDAYLLSKDVVTEQSEQKLNVPFTKGRGLSQSQDLDGLDAGITEKSDKIAQKVLQIQQKLELALSGDNHRSYRESGSESETSTSSIKPPRPPRTIRIPPSRSPRPRSLSPTPESPDATEQGTVSTEVPPTPTLTSSITPSTTVSTVPPSTPGLTTDESDVEYQSAYSASDHGSQRSFKDQHRVVIKDGIPPGGFHIFGEEAKTVRERATSNATARRMKIDIKTSNSTLSDSPANSVSRQSSRQFPRAA